MKVLSRDNLPSEYTEMMKTEEHHNHEVVEINGIIRWKEDPFVRRFVDACNLNDIIEGLHFNGNDKNSEMYRELYRRMGYSLSGYWELFYWDMNNEAACEYSPPLAQ